jgi:hypothetical protein
MIKGNDMITINPRLGIGLDIEYNEDVCHIVEFDNSDKEEVVGFMGIIIKLPFVSIYIGDFFELD